MIEALREIVDRSAGERETRATLPNGSDA